MKTEVIEKRKSESRWAEIDEASRLARRLRDELERVRRQRATRAGWRQRYVPTRLAALDAVLPYGGLPSGAITEIFADGPGVGSLSLALRIARRCAEPEGCCVDPGHAYPPAAGKHGTPSVPHPKGWGTQHCSSSSGTPEISPPSQGMGHPALLFEQWHTQDQSPTASGGAETLTPALSLGKRGGGRQWHRRNIVILDTLKDFYPPAALAYGVLPDGLIVLRPRSMRDAGWAFIQSLRCSAVAAVVATLTKLEERESRRLQLAAESSGCLGIALRPFGRGGKSFAAVQMRIESVRDHPAAAAGMAGAGAPGHVWRITLLKVREGMPVEPVLVDLHHETGALPVSALPVDRSTAKTG